MWEGKIDSPFLQNFLKKSQRYSCTSKVLSYFLLKWFQNDINTQIYYRLYFSEAVPRPSVNSFLETSLLSWKKLVWLTEGHTSHCFMVRRMEEPCKHEYFFCQWGLSHEGKLTSLIAFSLLTHIPDAAATFLWLPTPSCPSCHHLPSHSYLGSDLLSLPMDCLPFLQSFPHLLNWKPIIACQ